MYTFPTQPQSPFTIIGNSLRLYGKSFSKIWHWQLLFSLVYMAFIIGLDLLKPIIRIKSVADNELAMHAILLAGGIIMYLIAILGSCFIYNRIHNVAIQGNIQIAISMRAAFKKTWHLIWGYIMYVAFIVSSIVATTIKAFLSDIMQ